jgi:hypothetical protein
MASDNLLVSGERLLELIFDEESRPSLRWLHNQKKRRAIPYLKVGRLVRYDPDRVREAMSLRFTVLSMPGQPGIRLQTSCRRDTLAAG